MTNPIVSFINLKGGVGKTALAVNFAAYCGRQGLRTLLIDLDPQTNATFATIGIDMWETWAKDNGTIADIFGLRAHRNGAGQVTPIEDVILENVEGFKNVDVLPSHLDLFTIDLDLAGATARETILRRNLATLGEKYSIIVCDCPPNLTIPTQNALAASTHYVVPISPDFLSALGIGLLLSRVRNLCLDLEHQLSHAGIVISRIGRPAIHRAQTIETLRQQFNDKVLTNQINERAAVSEAAEKHMAIFDMKDALAAREFRDVSAELLERIGVNQ